MIFTGGKYKDSTFEEVLDKDPSYMKWLFSNPKIMSQEPELKHFLTDRFTEDDGSYMMTWGKHKLKGVKWIKENDYPYFEWLRMNGYVKKNCPKLKAAIEELCVINHDE